MLLHQIWLQFYVQTGSKMKFDLRHFKLPPRCRKELHIPGRLHSEMLVINYQHFGTISFRFLTL